MSHLSRRKPNPVDVLKLDPFDQAFLIYTGNLKLINPLETVAEVLKASGDLILWGPQAALLFRVLMNGWREAGGEDYTDEVVSTFDTDADPVTVNLSRLERILRGGNALGRRHWSEIEDKIPEILFETQYRSQIFYDKRFGDFIERIEEGKTVSETVFQTETGKFEKVEKVSRENFDQWFELQSPGHIQEYVNRFPSDVLHPRIRELATQASIKEGVRAIDRGEMINRIQNIPAIPHAQFDITGDVEVARAWNKTAVAMMSGYVVSEYQVISERDKKTCPVCQRIDGRVFEAQRAIEKMQEYDNVTPGNLDAIRELWKFPRIDDVDNVPPEQVHGLDLVPPFHPRCRCEVILLHSRFSGSTSFEFQNTMSMPYQERLLFRDRRMKDWKDHRDKTKQAAYRLMGNKKAGNVAVAQHGENITIAQYRGHKSGITVKEFYNFGRAQDRTIIENLAQMAKDKKGYLRVTNPASLREVKFLERAYFKKIKQGYQAEGSALDKIIAGKKKRLKKPAQVTPSEKVVVPTHADPAPGDFEKRLLQREKEIAGLRHERAIIMNSKGDFLFSKTGHTRHVSFDTRERGFFKQNVLIHNHPSGQSFSPNDIQCLIVGDLNEVRAVGAQWRHSMRIDFAHPDLQDLIKSHGRGSKYMRYRMLEEFDKVYKRRYRAVLKRLDKLVNEGKITIPEWQERLWHEVWTDISKKITWLRYERTDWFLSVEGRVAQKTSSVMLNKEVLESQKGKFVIDLGDIPESKITPLGGGVNETRIVELPNGEKAVFKPIEGERFGLRGSITNEACPLAHREALSWEIDDILGLDLVPETRLVSINGEIGSLQHFQKSAKIAARAGGTAPLDDELYKIDVFDFLIGNTDRHQGNYMFYTRGAKKGRVIAIDNGYVFPRSSADIDIFGVDEFRSAPALDYRSRKPELNKFLTKSQKNDLVEKLNSLDVEQLGRKYSLDVAEIEGLDKRRSLLIKLIQDDNLHELFQHYGGWGQTARAAELYQKYMQG